MLYGKGALLFGHEMSTIKISMFKAYDLLQDVDVVHFLYMVPVAL